MADCEIEAQRAFLVKTTKLFSSFFGDLLIKTDMYIPKEYIFKKQNTYIDGKAAAATSFRF